MRWATAERLRDWCSTPRLRSAFALLAIAFALAAMLANALQPSPYPPGPAGRDFEAYYAAGATWNAGGDPWSRDIWRVERTIPGVDATRDELLPYVGPAAALPLWGALARVPIDVARAIWFALLALAFGVLALCARQLGSRPHSGFEAATAVLFGAVTAPVVSDIALAQAALVSAAALAITCVALDRRSPLAIVTAFAAAIQPNLALPLLARSTDRRALIFLGAAAAVFLAIGFAAGGGIAGFATYVQRLAAHGESERFIAIQYAPQAVLASFGMSRQIATLTGSLIALAAIGTASLAAFRFRTRPSYGVAIAIALLPLIVPFFHEHDFVMLVIPAIVFGTTADVRTRLLAGIAAICVFVDWLGFAQRPFATTGIALLGLAVACAYPALTKHTARTPAAFAPLATCALLLAALVPLALAHPAPMWPYLLGDFHAPAALDASGVWALEQQRNGLDALVPAWGVLRAVPLAGCVLLAVAGFRAAHSAATEMAA